MISAFIITRLLVEPEESEFKDYTGDVIWEGDGKTYKVKILGRNKEGGYDFEWKESKAKTYNASLSLVSNLKAPVYPLVSLTTSFSTFEGDTCLSEFEGR